VGFDLDLTLRRGERTIAARVRSGGGITALVGPQGVGKTSVLMMVAGLVRPDEGRIAVGGEVLCDTAQGLHLPPERRACGMVFQDHRLFPHLSVQANLRYGMRRGGDGPAGDGQLPWHRSLAQAHAAQSFGRRGAEGGAGAGLLSARAFC
jgi:molybdate transport system ATP-binding protein